MINRFIENGKWFMLIVTGEAERGNAGEQPFEE